LGGKKEKLSRVPQRDSKFLKRQERIRGRKRNNKFPADEKCARGNGKTSGEGRATRPFLKDVSHKKGRMIKRAGEGEEEGGGEDVLS